MVEGGIRQIPIPAKTHHCADACGLNDVSLLTDSFDVAMLFRVWSTGSGGCVVGGLSFVLIMPADCWSSAVFGVVGGGCLRVGWRLRGLDWFSAFVFRFGPWFGCFGRMDGRWSIVVVCVIHWNLAVLWCCRGRRTSAGQCSCGLVLIPSRDLRFGPGM